MLRIALLTLTLSTSLFARYWDECLGMMIEDGDCISCDRQFLEHPNYELCQSSAMEAINAVNTDSFSVCFEQYDRSVGVDPNEARINAIDTNNALFVCGCISEVMDGQPPIAPVSGELSDLTQEALGTLAIGQAVKLLGAEQRYIEHDLKELGVEVPSCNLEEHMKAQQESCATDKALLKKVIAREFAKPSKLSTHERPPLTQSDLVYTPAILRAEEALSANATTRMNYMELGAAEARQALQAFAQTNSSRAQQEVASYFAQTPELSRQAHSPNRWTFGQSRDAAYETVLFLKRNYLRYIPRDHPDAQLLEGYFQNSRSTSRETSEQMLNQILPKVVPLMVESKCTFLKERFDRICNASSKKDVLSAIPEVANEAYLRLSKYANSDKMAHPALLELDKELGKNLTTSISEINHMIACQDRSQSLLRKYEACPVAEKSFGEMTEGEQRSCLDIQKLGSQSCPAYQALFQNNPNFRQMVISANIGITNVSENLDSVLYAPDAVRLDNNGTPQCLLNPNDENQKKFRKVLDRYISEQIFAKKFANDVITTGSGIDDAPETSQSMTSCAFCSGDTTTTITTSDYSSEVISTTPLADIREVQIPEEVSAILPENLAKENDENIQPFMGPINPNTLYDTNAPSAKEQDEPIKVGEINTNTDDPKIAALMAEIERLNQKLLDNEQEIDVVDEKLQATDLSEEQRHILEEERAELEREREKLQKLKEMKNKQAVAQAQKAEEIKKSQAASGFGNGVEEKPTPTDEDEQSGSSLGGGTGSSGALTSGGMISESGGDGAPIASNDLLDLRQRRLALGSTVIDDVTVAQAFFQGSQTFTTHNLILPNPSNPEEEFRCHILKDKKTGEPIKKEPPYSSEHYNCLPYPKAKKIQESGVEAQSTTTKPNTEPTEEGESVSFEDAKKTIDSQ